MNSTLSLSAFALTLIASSAQAQTPPVFVQLPAGTLATDLTVTPLEGVIVVGTTAGGAFRWTQAGGLLTVGTGAPHGSVVRISADGTKMAWELPQTPLRVGVWDGSLWNPIPGLGGVSSGGDS